MNIQEKIRVTELNVSRGKQDPRDLELLKRHGVVLRPATSRPTEPLDVLIGHMEKFYTNDLLKSDLDCVLSLCETEADRKEIRRYARCRLGGKPYSGPVAASNATCGGCGKPFHASRSTARFCSPRCRVRASRK